MKSDRIRLDYNKINEVGSFGHCLCCCNSLLTSNYFYDRLLQTLATLPSVSTKLRLICTNSMAAISQACSMRKVKCHTELSTLVDTENQFRLCFSKKSMVLDLSMLPLPKPIGTVLPMVFSTRVWRVTQECQVLTKLSSQNAFTPCGVWLIPLIWWHTTSLTSLEKVASTGSTLWLMIHYISLVTSLLRLSKKISFSHPLFHRFCGGQTQINNLVSMASLDYAYISMFFTQSLSYLIT